jgi:hypothetical protein
MECEICKKDIKRSVEDRHFKCFKSIIKIRSLELCNVYYIRGMCRLEYKHWKIIIKQEEFYDSRWVLYLLGDKFKNFRKVFKRVDKERLVERIKNNTRRVVELGSDMYWNVNKIYVDMYKNYSWCFEI